MTVFLGLTGSVGMGKSTTASMFKDEGVPVYDADATVHHLYENEAAVLIEEAFPGTTGPAGVDRKKLSDRVIGDEQAMQRLEKIIHPLVRREELSFRKRAEAAGAICAVFDIPLLFETGREAHFDKIVVVTAPADIQRSRVMARPGMSEEKFTAILARQLPDGEKRKRADYLIDTSGGMEQARKDVLKIISDIQQQAQKPGL